MPATNWPTATSWPSATAWPSATSWPSGNSYNPATAPGAKLWLAGAADAYSDTGGTVPATSPAGRVRRVNQPTPMSGNWQATSDAIRAFREPAAFSFQIGDQCSIVQPGAVTVDADNCLWGFSGMLQTKNGGASNTTMAFFGNDSLGTFGHYVSSNQLRIQSKGAAWNTAIGIPYGSSYCFTLLCTAAGLSLRAMIDGGAIQTASLSQAMPTGNITAVNVGLGNTLNGQFSISNVYAAETIAAADEANLLAYLNATRPGLPVDTRFIGGFADSNIAGVGTVTQQLAAAYAMQKGLNAAGYAPRMLLDAVSGQRLSDAITDLPTMLAQYSASRSKNVLYLQTGAASLVDATGLTAPQCMAQAWQIADAWTALGGTVLVSTVLPITAGSVGAGFDARRLAYNALIAAELGSHPGCVMFDATLVAGIGTTADCIAGINYQVDQQHLNNSGEGLLAAALVTAMSAMM